MGVSEGKVGDEGKPNGDIRRKGTRYWKMGEIGNRKYRMEVGKNEGIWILNTSR